MDCIESRFVIGHSNIQSGGVYVCTFQPGNFTGCGSEGVKPVLNWANVCSPNILRTVRRTIIHFLIELLVRRTWCGQFDELYFVLNWLVMRCKLWPELAADSMIENVG